MKVLFLLTLMFALRTIMPLLVLFAFFLSYNSL